MKVTIAKCAVRDETRWRVRWHEAGRMHRKFFRSRVAADTLAARLKGEALTTAARLMALPPAKQEQLLFIHEESEHRGIPLANLLTMLASDPVKPTSVPSIEKVKQEMEVVKTEAGRAGIYLDNLRQIITRFAKGRESLAVDKFTVKEVEAFLRAAPAGSRQTIRARISTLFQFAIRRGYRTDNPCDRLEAIASTRPLPATLSLKETKVCLAWLQKHPRSLAWFALSTFAGLRPEEAEKTSWIDINFKEGWIKVEAQTTKIRQRRVVYPMPIALEWLRRAKRLKSQLPLTIKTRKADRNALRAVLGWKEWKKDVTRHTAASNWIAHSQSIKDVATALGNSESVLRRDYMALVTKADAEKFWALTAQAA
jgi:integrase